MLAGSFLNENRLSHAAVKCVKWKKWPEYQNHLLKASVYKLLLYTAESIGSTLTQRYVNIKSVRNEIVQHVEKKGKIQKTLPIYAAKRLIYMVPIRRTWLKMASSWVLKTQR